VVEQSGTDVGVPAPVAGIAERAVRAWLSATGPGDAPRLAELYVEPPVVRVEGGATLVPEDVTTVAGTRQMDGYWAVTVAARVVEVSDQAADAGADPAAAPATDPAANPGTGLEGSDEGVAGVTGEPVDATWYIQVGIVGDDAGGLKALTTPSILPGPPGTVADGWRSSASPTGSPTDDDPVASTVQGFLRALLADGGDPGRYLATGLRIDAADPPTFESVEVTTISVDDLGDGQTRALAQIEGRTSSGLVVTSSYEVILAERTDRLEITGFSGAPTLVVVPSADDPAATAADPDAPGASTTEPTDGGEAP
jgi:hypothetical protein